MQSGATGDNRCPFLADSGRGGYPRRCAAAGWPHDDVDASRNRRARGAVGPDHLSGLGLQILGRNWRCRYGELDVIAVDPTTNTVVFVEVKTRTGDGFGGLAQAVTEQKARRLRRLAAMWLATQEQRWAAVRIDVIGVRIGRRRTPEVSHLQGVG